MADNIRAAAQLDHCASPQSGYVSYSEFDALLISPKGRPWVDTTSKEFTINSPQRSSALSPKEVWHPQALRVKKLWQKTKEELDATREELATTKERYYRLGSQQRHLKAKEEEAGSLSIANRTLLEQLKGAEEHIDVLRREKNKLNHENSHLLSKMDSMTAEISIFEQRLDVHEDEMKASRQALHESKESEHKIKTQLLVSEREMSLLLAKKEEFIAKQQDNMEDVARENHRLKAFNETVGSCNKERETTVKAQGLQVLRLQTAYDKVTEDLLKEQKRTINGRQLEVELSHLKLDNQRMILLISATKEFEAFKYYAESGATSYLPPATEFEVLDGKIRGRDKDALMKWGKTITTLAREYDTPTAEDLPSTSFHAEEKNWIPRDALLLANQFKARHLLSLPIEIIYEFLRQLNTVWQRREKWKFTRIRGDVDEKVKQLERQAKNKIPYKGILQTREIARLKKEILTLYRGRQKRAMPANRVKHADKFDLISDSWEDARDTSFLAKSMATAEDLSRQLQESSKRNVHLEETIRIMHESQGRPIRKSNEAHFKNNTTLENRLDVDEITLQLENQRSHIFSDGVTWIGDRLLSLSEEFTGQWVALLNEARRKSHALPSGALGPEKRATALMTLLLHMDGNLRKMLNVFHEKQVLIYKEAQNCLLQEEKLLQKSTSMKDIQTTL